MTRRAFSNRQSAFSPLTPFLPLPKYFESEWSYAQYRIPVQSAHISLSATGKSSNVDLPEEERCIVAWIDAPPEDQMEAGSDGPYQLLALTFTGGWYRLAIPVLGTQKRPGSGASHIGSVSASPPKASSMHKGPGRSVSGSSTISRLDKGKEREKDKEKKESRNCVLKEYRRFGRWDGWG